MRRRNAGTGCGRCAFTGHRPGGMPFAWREEDPDFQAFRRELREQVEALIGEGYAHFFSGGAMGMDIAAAETVLDMKKRYPWIRLEMVIPYPGQAEKWPEAWRQRHARLLREADDVKMISDAYDRGCMFRRNRYLVDHADVLLAAFDGHSGGTAMTCGYAMERGVPVRRLRLKGGAA